MGRPWTEADQKQAEELAAQGLTFREIGKRLGRDNKTVKEHLPDYQSPYRPERPWTEKEKQRLFYHKVRGKSYAEIGRLMGRSKRSVESAWNRRIAEIRSDPRYEPTMRVLSFCLNPERVLKAVRDSGIAPTIANESDERLLEFLEKARGKADVGIDIDNRPNHARRSKLAQKQISHSSAADDGLRRSTPDALVEKR